MYKYQLAYNLMTRRHGGQFGPYSLHNPIQSKWTEPETYIYLEPEQPTMDNTKTTNKP